MCVWKNEPIRAALTSDSTIWCLMSTYNTVIFGYSCMHRYTQLYLYPIYNRERIMPVTQLPSLHLTCLLSFPGPLCRWISHTMLSVRQDTVMHAILCKHTASTWVQVTIATNFPCCKDDMGDNGSGDYCNKWNWQQLEKKKLGKNRFTVTVYIESSSFICCTVYSCGLLLLINAVFHSNKHCSFQPYR